MTGTDWYNFWMGVVTGIGGTVVFAVLVVVVGLVIGLWLEDRG